MPVGGEMESSQIQGIIGIVIIFAIIIYFGYNRSKSQAEQKAKKQKKFSEYGFMKEYEMGTYLTGFSCADKKNFIICGEAKDHFIFISEDDLEELGKIPIKDITKVTIEDKTTIDKRVTLTRIAMIGIFALGVQKKRTEEVYFFVIDWNSGKIPDTAVFEFRRRDKANEALYNMKKRINKK